ncbi:MAG: HAMP domain-containing histidine kinase [Deltaproteobacteria bacterium]|nr:HAMP domain-containing histidine kinase [Deltaproteobacteria bacterium]
MTVKRRISLLVAGAGLVASLVFSLAVFFELVEQPFEILDAELEAEAQRAVRTVMERQEESGPIPSDPAANEIYAYWLKIVEQDSGKLLYQSGLTKSVNLPLLTPGTSKTVNITLPAEQSPQGQELRRETTFRVKRFSFALDGKEFTVQIARPMEKLQEEIWELVYSLAAGLILSSLVLIAFSNFIAGKILKPIGEMKDLTKDISEKNLGRRLPVGPGGDEFNQLAKTINRMLDRLQHSFVKQRNFLFDTSHELKTPLTTMRLSIDEVCSSDMESMSSSAKDNLLRLNEQVLRMERLVKDLLNLSSLEMVDAIEKGPVSLLAILESLVADYRFFAEAQSIQMDLHLHALSDIDGDKKKLTRAFSNILDNAIKYNVDGGNIIVEGKQMPDMMTISVTNTGPGVAGAEIDKVFDQFYRVEKSRSIEHGGSGLGLAIVKRIVELHDGSVRLESQPGQWTRVTVCLPFDRRTTV